jgi:hypothetical protein
MSSRLRPPSKIIRPSVKLAQDPKVEPAAVAATPPRAPPVAGAKRKAADMDADAKIAKSAIPRPTATRRTVASGLKTPAVAVPRSKLARAAAASTDATAKTKVTAARTTLKKPEPVKKTVTTTARALANSLRANQASGAPPAKKKRVITDPKVDDLYQIMFNMLLSNLIDCRVVLKIWKK